MNDNEPPLMVPLSVDTLTNGNNPPSVTVPFARTSNGQRLPALPVPRSKVLAVVMPLAVTDPLAAPSLTRDVPTPVRSTRLPPLPRINALVVFGAYSNCPAGDRAITRHGECIRSRGDRPLRPPACRWW